MRPETSPCTHHQDNCMVNYNLWANVENLENHITNLVIKHYVTCPPNNATWRICIKLWIVSVYFYFIVFYGSKYLCRVYGHIINILSLCKSCIQYIYSIYSIQYTHVWKLMSWGDNKHPQQYKLNEKFNVSRPSSIEYSTVLYIINSCVRYSYNPNFFTLFIETVAWDFWPFFERKKLHIDPINGFAKFLVWRRCLQERCSLFFFFKSKTNFKS